MGPLASMVTDTVRPAWPSDGLALQVTPALRAGTIGARRPMTSTAANRAPTACTQPDPLEWATPAQARTATTLPTTGASQATGCSRARSRTPPGTRSGSERADRRANTPHETRAPASVATSPTAAPATTTAGPKTARMTSTTHPPATSPVAIALTVRRSSGRRSAPWRAHVGGTGVSSTIRVTSAGPSPPPPSAMSRWERHATATAWMSWGLT